MFISIKRIDEQSYVAALCDPLRDRDALVLIEFDDDDNLMLTDADALDETSDYDNEFLRSFFSDEYALEYKPS